MPKPHVLPNKRDNVTQGVAPKTLPLLKNVMMLMRTPPSISLIAFEIFLAFEPNGLRDDHRPPTSEKQRRPPGPDSAPVALLIVRDSAEHPPILRRSKPY